MYSGWQGLKGEFCAMQRIGAWPDYIPSENKGGFLLENALLAKSTQLLLQVCNFLLDFALPLSIRNIISCGRGGEKRRFRLAAP
jgi:hypothetical protein